MTNRDVTASVQTQQGLAQRKNSIDHRGAVHVSPNIVLKSSVLACAVESGKPGMDVLAYCKKQLKIAWARVVEVDGNKIRDLPDV